jgi:hypothetical protein
LREQAILPSVVAANGGKAKTDKSVRMFMVPGMGRCGGGDGPNTFDIMRCAVAHWLE